jgi:hypothetical protein
MWEVERNLKQSAFEMTQERDTRTSFPWRVAVTTDLRLTDKLPVFTVINFNIVVEHLNVWLGYIILCYAAHARQLSSSFGNISNETK